MATKVKKPSKKKKAPKREKRAKPEWGKSKAGRKSKYSEVLFNKICERISTSTDGLHKICKEFKISTVTFYAWLKNDDIEFLNTYTRARETQADLLADEIIEIADRTRIGKKIVDSEEKGKTITTGDMVERSKIMIDARKWKASKLYPKRYGDRFDLTTKGEKLEQAPLIVVMSEADKKRLDEV